MSQYKEKSMIKCKKDNCSNYVSKSGYCAYHYSQVIQCLHKPTQSRFLNESKDKKGLQL